MGTIESFMALITPPAAAGATARGFLIWSRQPPAAVDRLGGRAEVPPGS